MPTGSDDLTNHVVGGPPVCSLTGQSATDVVHDDLRTARGQQECVLAAQPTAAAGDDGDAVVEAQGHLISSPARSPAARQSAIRSSKA